jgi:hypothetical protein
VLRVQQAQLALALEAPQLELMLAEIVELQEYLLA